MQGRIGREHGARFQTNLVAIKVGEYAAGFFDNHRQRRNIEDIDVGFDDGLDLARCQQVVVIKVAVTTDTVGVGNDLPELRPAGAPRERFQVAG